MDRRSVIVSIGGVALAWPLPARTQPTRRVVRIGIVSVGGPSADMTGALPKNRNVRAFLRGMAELGYVYGRDLVTEPRGTDAMPAVADLVGLQVDVIVATGAGTTLSLLKQATTAIPIVMTAAPDPVGEGFAQSLSRPGGNLTGMSLQSLELTGKRLQLLREVVPSAETVGILWDSTSPELWPTAQAFGQPRGWKLLSVEVRDSSEIAAAFKRAAEAGAGALRPQVFYSAALPKLPKSPR